MGSPPSISEWLGSSCGSVTKAESLLLRQLLMDRIDGPLTAKSGSQASAELSALDSKESAIRNCQREKLAKARIGVKLR